MASYELNARPYSDWINAFTLDEWVTFGYNEDLYYYYCAGYVSSPVSTWLTPHATADLSNRPGDKNMAAVGAVYANASLTLLNEGPSSGTLWFNL